MNDIVNNSRTRATPLKDEVDDLVQNYRAVAEAAAALANALEHVRPEGRNYMEVTYVADVSMHDLQRRIAFDVETYAKNSIEYLIAYKANL